MFVTKFLVFPQRLCYSALFNTFSMFSRSSHESAMTWYTAQAKRLAKKDLCLGLVDLVCKRNQNYLLRGGDWAVPWGRGGLLIFIYWGVFTACCPQANTLYLALGRIQLHLQLQLLRDSNNKRAKTKNLKRVKESNISGPFNSTFCVHI